MTESQNSVIVRLKGGLGNQLFQYATARALAIDTRRTLHIDTGWYDRKSRPRKYRLNEFNIEQRTVSYSKAQLRLARFKSKLVQMKLASGAIVTTEPKDLSFHPFEQKQNVDLLLEGYWQSYRYFSHHSQTLLEDFKLADFVDTSTLHQPPEQTVAVHIRRGDYITTKSAHIVTAQYIQNAVAEFGNNHDFLFFSDDIAWCKQTFKGSNFAFSNQPSDLMDLVQMSMCSHNIIANSSFSWWSAWLNDNPDKRVIAPAPWTEGGATHRDILPENWNTLPIK